MKYLNYVPKVRAILEADPHIGARRMATLLGCERDCARRAMSVAKAEAGPYSGERIGFLDIEATGLKASFAVTLSYCIKTAGADGRLIARSIKPDDLRNRTFDRNLLERFSVDARQFDRLVTWNGSYYDIPFLRTRALLHGIDFPVFGEVMHTDALFIARHRLRMHSNRLQAVCEFFQIPSKEHRLDPVTWTLAMAGDRKALKWILEHNKEDVISLEAVWDKIHPYALKNQRSI